MKFFIVGLHSSGKQEIIDILEDYGVKCGRLFSNLDIQSSEIYNSYNYELYDNTDVHNIFENNAYIFINELDGQSCISSYKYYEGLSKYEFDNNDVFCLSPDQLLNVSKNNIKDDICFIWVDNNREYRLNRYKREKRAYNFSEREEKERHDINEFVKVLYSYNAGVLYFVNEEPGRIASIIYSIIKHPELKGVFEKHYN